MEELRSKVQSVVTDLYSALDRLVNNEGVGLIQWLNGSLCKFHFFRDVVVHELQKSTAHETRTVSRPNASSQFVTTVSEVRAQSGVNTQRLARHEHELMNAVAQSVQECSLIIPRTVQRVVELIPDWLQPLAKIVSGDCIR